jgi:1-pyrroline-5-carboxylate dehydrogenase
MLDQPLPLPRPSNEPILGYAPHSPERASLKEALKALGDHPIELPHHIGGKPSHEGTTFDVCAPHDHRKVLGRARSATTAVTEQAITAALQAAPGWAAMPFDDRARIFLRAAEMLAGPWRATLNAATMLGQSKTSYQAEIDSACELIDFLRFNVHFASQLTEQPFSPPGTSNALELRPLEGFVFAVTPFNFTAIAGNLPSAPALLGNTVVWKAAENQAFAAHQIMQLFEAAGLPPGVINLVHGDGRPVGAACLASKHLAGVHFTGSTAVFQSLWRGVGENIASYRTYPRIVGETGGKDFVFAHPSADADALSVALVRGAFEYQGQKCSAASRAYIPASLWPGVKERIVGEASALSMGDVADFKNFMGAVIHERSWNKLHGKVQEAKHDPHATVLLADRWSREDGWFAGPTLIEVSDPKHALMQEELFGPVLTIFVYDDARLDETLALVDETSPYALTGSLFARDRVFLEKAGRVLRQAAGNLYINDKPTGAVVGQQPFGGARASGTNDKAGSAYNLLRWASPRTVKETFVSPTSVGYPHQTES